MKQILIATFVTILSGCTTYGEKFDCGAGKGVGCKSLSFVNKAVEKGILPYDMDETQDIELPHSELPPGSTSDTKIWIAGHRDNHGFYHEPSYVRLR